MLYYFGTDLATAGHYFWELNGYGILGLRGYGFKNIPFNPESVPLSRDKGDVERYVMTDFTRGISYTIMAICGSPVDTRQGCRSVFWIEGGDFEKLDKLIRDTPAAMAIINKMPFPVQHFKPAANV